MTRYRRPLAVVLTAVAAVVVAGCGTGRHPQILDIKNTVNGAQADLAHATIQVRNAYVTPTVPGEQLVPAGQRLALHAYVFNIGKSPDTLVGVSAGTTAATLTPASGIAVPVDNYIVIGGAASSHGNPASVSWSAPAALFVGTNVAVRLDFGTAGSATLSVPVEYAESSSS